MVVGTVKPEARDARDEENLSYWAARLGVDPVQLEMALAAWRRSQEDPDRYT